MFELFFWARDRRTLAMEDGLIAHKIAAHAAKMEEGTWHRAVQTTPGFILKRDGDFLTQRRKGEEDAELRSQRGRENVYLRRTSPHASALSAFPIPSRDSGLLEQLLGCRIGRL